MDQNLVSNQPSGALNPTSQINDISQQSFVYAGFGKRLAAEVID